MSELLQGQMFPDDADGSTSSRVRSPARTSVSPERELDSTVIARRSSLNSPDLLMKSDRLGSSLRMSLRSAAEAVIGCSLSWTDSGTPGGRAWWVLGRSGRRTRGTGRGSSADAWTSSTCRDAESLAKVTRGAGSAAKGNQIIEPLAVQAQNWPTCWARDYRSPNLRPYAERGGKTKGEQLPNFLRHWNTPSAQDCEQAGSAAHGGLTNDARVSAGPPVPARTSTSGKHRDLRTPTDENRGVHPHPDSKAGQHSLTTQAKGQLNPAWVLQLQGLPDGWLDLPDATLSRLSATRTRRGCRSSSGGG